MLVKTLLVSSISKVRRQLSPRGRKTVPKASTGYGTVFHISTFKGWWFYQSAGGSRCESQMFKKIR